MKKFLLAALCAASAVYAGPFVTWNGADGVYQVETGLGNETGTYGVWYDFNDSWAYSGSSKISYKINPCYEYDPECIKHFFDPIIDYCVGICGTAVLDKGSSTTTPFAGVGFNVVGETSTTNTTPAAGDASAWGGLCVTYTSDIEISLEQGLGDAIDSTMNYALPAVKLPASKTGNKVIVSWSDFKQPSWYDGAVKFDGETAAKQLVGVHFKIQAEPGDYEFNICAVGPKDGTCPEKCGTPTPSDAIKVTREVSAVQAFLKGHTLNFIGVKSASVEVLNSLGQIVAKGAIENSTSTLNLAHLDAGVYLVRISGKTFNFSNKIVLK